MTSPTATADLIEFRLRNIGESDRQHEPPMTWAEAEALLAALRAAEAERDRAREALRLALDNIQGIADGTDIPSTHVRAVGRAALGEVT